MISLINETIENDRLNSKRYALSVVEEYNFDLKQFIGVIYYKLTGCMKTGLIIRIIRNIRSDYLERVDNCVKLNEIEKNWLKNYIVARYRESVKPFIGQA